MTSWGKRIGRCGWGRRFLPALWLATALIPGLSAPVSAQLLSDHPPPIPPASVPEPAPAMNLAPPSGAGAGPSVPAPLTQPTIVQPSVATVPPVVPPPGASTAGQ